MRSFVAPLEELQAATGFFLVERELRVLLVATDDLLRGPVTTQLGALEAHADCEARVVCLDDADERFEDTLLGFARAEARRPSPGLDGRRTASEPGAPEPVVAVLTPASPASAGSAVLAAVIDSVELAHVRWIYVDADPVAARASELAVRLHRRAWSLACRVDRAAYQRELGTRLAGVAAACGDDGAAPHARAGGAWPASVRPPARAWSPRSLPQDEPHGEELEVVRQQQALGEVGPLVLAAAGAMALGETSRAVALQRRACERADAGGLAREGLKLALLLATYQLQLARAAGGGLAAAATTFARVGERAAREQLWQEAAEAQLGLAQVQLLRGEPGIASATFVHAGRLAVRAESPTFAIRGLSRRGSRRAGPRRGSGCPRRLEPGARGRPGSAAGGRARVVGGRGRAADGRRVPA